MIRTFRDRETERLFQGQRSRAFPPAIRAVAQRKLDQLHRAQSLNDLRQPPGNRLEVLRGDRVEQWSIRINDQWRICFIWDNDAYGVEIVDYH